jgi:hypothetical protein
MKPCDYLESPDGESTLPCHKCKKQTLSGYAKDVNAPLFCPTCYAGKHGLKVLKGGKPSSFSEACNLFKSIE